jgi:hypothetical protein
MSRRMPPGAMNVSRVDCNHACDALLQIRRLVKAISPARPGLSWLAGRCQLWYNKKKKA